MSEQEYPGVDPLEQSQLLSGFDPAQRSAFMDLATIVALEEPGSLIVREGEPAENFYFILEGETEVFKREPKTGNEAYRTTLGPGDHFGETSLLREGNRTATVRTRSPDVVLVMVHARQVREAPHEHSWLTPLLLGLDRMTHQTLDELRHQLDECRVRAALERTVLLVILALSAYALGLAMVRELLGAGLVQGTLTRVLDVGLAAAVIALVRAGPIQDWSFFGLRWPDKLGRELGELALASLVGVAGLSGLALAMVGAGAEPLFHGPEHLFVEAVYLFGVAGIVGIEQLCVRGVLQSSLSELFHGHGRSTLVAIVLSNALFAAAHIPLSIYYALVQLALGLLWGVVYARHRSLLGVTIAHILVGYFALRVLRIDELIASTSS